MKKVLTIKALKMRRVCVVATGWTDGYFNDLWSHIKFIPKRCFVLLLLRLLLNKQEKQRQANENKFLTNVDN